MISQIQIMISQIDSYLPLIVLIMIAIIVGLYYNKSKKNLKSEQFTNEGYSDRELQEQILKTLKLNQKDNEIIKNWVVFWSWLSIIGMVIYIFFFKCDIFK